ncbi:hypothetical protein BGZ76_002592 [Entomortierella beljakovae]|nr:hypothetical protein BGZ76_002592 [Entomortierella beljakovae]
MLSSLSLPTSLFVFTYLSWITPLASADLNCQSPSGSQNLGDTVAFRWSDDGTYPRIGDVYSATAKIYCSSSSAELSTISGISNGQSWTIPQDILEQCQGNQIYVEYNGEQWDSLHLLHLGTYKINCRDISLSISSPSPTESATGTTSTITPTNNATAPVITTTAPTSITNSAVTATLPSLINSSSSTLLTPSVSIQPGSNTTINESKTNIPAAALGTVAGIVVVALIIFGMIRARKRRLEKRSALQGKLNKSGFGGASPIGRGRRGDSREDSWDQHGSLPSLEFVPLQHQVETREYRQHPSQSSSLQRSITHVPVRPVSGYRGDDPYWNNYGHGQNYNHRYIDGYTYEEGYIPEEIYYGHSQGIVATQQPTGQEYYGRLRNIDGSEIPPPPSSPIPSIPPTPAPSTPSANVSEGAHTFDFQQPQKVETPLRNGAMLIHDTQDITKEE